MSGPLLASYIVLWVLVVILATAVLALYNHFGQMYMVGREGRERQGPPLDQRLEETLVSDLSGEVVRLPAFERPTLIAFTSTTCPSCAGLIPDLTAVLRGRPDLFISIVCEGADEDVRQWAAAAPSGLHVAVDSGSRIALAHRVVTTPFVIAIDAQGIVRAKGVVSGFDALSTIAASIAASAESADGEVSHESVPRVEHASSL